MYLLFFGLSLSSRSCICQWFDLVTAELCLTSLSESSIPCMNNWFGLRLPFVDSLWLFHSDPKLPRMLLTLGAKNVMKAVTVSFIEQIYHVARLHFIKRWFLHCWLLNVIPHSFKSFIMSRATSDSSRGGPPVNCFHYSPHLYFFSSWSVLTFSDKPLSWTLFSSSCKTVVGKLFGKYFRKTIILECPSTPLPPPMPAGSQLCPLWRGSTA